MYITLSVEEIRSWEFKGIPLQIPLRMPRCLGGGIVVALGGHPEIPMIPSIGWTAQGHGFPQEIAGPNSRPY